MAWKGEGDLLTKSIKSLAIHIVNIVKAQRDMYDFHYIYLLGVQLG